MSIEVYFILLILGFPSYFLSRWIVHKYVSDLTARKFAVWTSTIILAPLLYFGFILVWISCMSYYPSNDFDIAVWNDEIDKRYEISEDLIESRILIGKTKLEVRTFLGDENNNSDQSEEWYYILGFRPQLFGIDPDFLIIKFEGGKVSSVEQRSS